MLCNPRVIILVNLQTFPPKFKLHYCEVIDIYIQEYMAYNLSIHLYVGACTMTRILIFPPGIVESLLGMRNAVAPRQIMLSYEFEWEKQAAVEKQN